jgi:plasmid rolling circle replication initiator protein Rep
MSFQGNFSTLEGVVAVSGVSFTGNVNALIKGTIINYSNDPMFIGGNSVMNFDRINSTKIPAGFDTHRVLNYNSSSYEELPN